MYKSLKDGGFKVALSPVHCFYEFQKRLRVGIATKKKFSKFIWIVLKLSLWSKSGLADFLQGDFSPNDQPSSERSPGVDEEVLLGIVVNKPKVSTEQIVKNVEYQYRNCLSTFEVTWICFQTPHIGATFSDGKQKARPCLLKARFYLLYPRK